jgi:hypothetical protein
MLRPRVPRKVFGGRSAARKARDELWAAVLPLVLYVVFGKVSIMVLESHRRDMTNKQINDDVIDRSTQGSTWRTYWKADFSEGSD